MPWKAAPACLDLEFSTAVESEDESGDEKVNVDAESPRRPPPPRRAPTSGKEAEVLSSKDAEAPASPKKVASSFGTKGGGGEGSSSSSDSSSYFIRDADPEAVAVELGAKPTTCLLYTSPSPRDS